MWNMQDSAMKHAVLALFMVGGFRLFASGPWLVEMRSFDAFQSRQKSIGNTVGNAMLPMMLVSFTQQRIVRMYGKMRAADPIRWAGYSDDNGQVDVVMVYPTVDKVAKMVLNHTGAEKVSGDTVLLPADEGRPIPTYAVFASDFTYCAFARTPELAKRALGEKYPAAASDLFAISAEGASGAFDFDDKGFKFTARTVTPETAKKLKGVPFLGELAQEGVTKYITFEDVKRLVSSLVKDFAAANSVIEK